jgi:RNA polymerase sigma-70 factor (ECF subfamily)
MADKTTDYELIKAYINGNEAAFNKIVVKYQQKIYWHARRMTSDHMDADEIVQEVLIVLYKKLKDFKFQSSLYTWIYRITATRSINFINKKKLKSLFTFNIEEKSDIQNKEDLVKDLENREKLERLDQILKKLPVRQREVFSMRHFDEMSYEEISEITGKSVGGLKANYFYAISKVNELMKEGYETK